MRRRKTFLFAFLVLSLLLAACVRSGGTEGENSYTIYYPAAELRDVPGEDAIVARTVQLPDADTLTQEELAQRLLERLLADAPDAGVRATDAGRDDASEPVGPWQLGAGGLLAAVCAPCGH